MGNDAQPFQLNLDHKRPFSAAPKEGAYVRRITGWDPNKPVGFAEEWQRNREDPFWRPRAAGIPIPGADAQQKHQAKYGYSNPYITLQQRYDPRFNPSAQPGVPIGPLAEPGQPQLTTRDLNTPIPGVLGSIAQALSGLLQNSLGGPMGARAPAPQYSALSALPGIGSDATMLNPGYLRAQYEAARAMTGFHPNWR